jgi:hypothetical protein
VQQERRNQSSCRWLIPEQLSYADDSQVGPLGHPSFVQITGGFYLLNFFEKLRVCEILYCFFIDRVVARFMHVVSNVFFRRCGSIKKAGLLKMIRLARLGLCQSLLCPIELRD